MTFSKKTEELLKAIMICADNNNLAVMPCKDKDGGDHFVLIALAAGAATPLAIIRDDIGDFLAKPQGETQVLQIGRVCGCGECHTSDPMLQMLTANKPQHVN